MPLLGIWSPALTKEAGHRVRAPARRSPPARAFKSPRSCASRRRRPRSSARRPCPSRRHHGQQFASATRRCSGGRSGRARPAYRGRAAREGRTLIRPLLARSAGVLNRTSTPAAHARIVAGNRDHVQPIVVGEEQAFVVRPPAIRTNATCPWVFSACSGSAAKSATSDGLGTASP